MAEFSEVGFRIPQWPQEIWQEIEELVFREMWTFQGHDFRTFFQYIFPKVLF